MKKLLILLLAVGVVVAAAAYRIATRGNLGVETLPVVGPVWGAWTHDSAPIVSPATQLAPGVPLDSQGDTQIAVVTEPDNPQTVTSSEETLPTESNIDVVTAVPETVPMPESMPQLVAVPVVSRKAELAGQLALLIAAVQADLPQVSAIAEDTTQLAKDAGDAVLVDLLADFAEAPASTAAVTEDQSGWLGRWVKVKKTIVPSATSVDRSALAALLDHYVKNYMGTTPAGEQAGAGGSW